MIEKHIRQDVLKMLTRAGRGNTAHNLSSTEILTALYYKVLKHDPRYPEWPNRDRVFVCEDHIPSWQTTMAHRGYYSKNLTKTKERPHELSTAVGSALAAKLDGKSYHTFYLASDKEHNKGATWEAIMFAGKHKLNMTVIIDRNNTQADGYTEDVMPLEPLRKKYEAFNWNVIETDGHNKTHLIKALKEAKENEKPTAIIAHTIAGKGVSFMENDHEWHEKTPTKEEETKALAELK